MKKFIKLISFVLITVLCLGIVPTVFAAETADLNAYTGTYTEAKDFTAGFYSTDKSYFNAVSSNKISASKLKDYKYFIVELAAKPTENVNVIYLANKDKAMSKHATSGWNSGEWNRFKYIFERQTVTDDNKLPFTVSTYINGTYIERTTYTFENADDTTSLSFRFNIGVVNGAEYATLKSYATNTTPDIVYSEKNIGENYAIDGSRIYVKSGITTAKALCDAVIGDNTDSVQAKIMPKDKNTAADYTDADTYTLENGDSIAVRTLQSDGKYKKTLHTINLDKTAVILSGDSISSVKQNYSDDFTGFDDAKSLKATAYAKDAGKIYFAQYDVDGNLLSVDAKDVAAGEFASVDFAKAEGMSEVKTFLWNNASFAPLAGSQVLKPIASSTTAE